MVPDSSNPLREKLGEEKSVRKCASVSIDQVQARLENLLRALMLVLFAEVLAMSLSPRLFGILFVVTVVVYAVVAVRGVQKKAYYQHRIGRSWARSHEIQEQLRRSES